MAEHLWVEFRLQFAFVTVRYDQSAFIEFDALWDGVQWVWNAEHAAPVWQVHIPAVLLHDLLDDVVKYPIIGFALYTSFVVQANGAVCEAGEAVVKCLVVILTQLADFFASSGRIIPFILRSIAMILITVFWRQPIALIATLMAAFA
jgi:hypothetical protein